MIVRRLSILAASLPLLYLAGCPDTKPGVELGTYDVVATRSAGTCGAWREQGAYSFRVRLTVRQGVLRWAESAGRTIDGSVDTRARSFQVSLEESAQILAANRVTGYVGCTIVRQDVINGIFDGPIPDGSDAGAPAVDAARGDASIDASATADASVTNDAAVDAGAQGGPPFQATLTTAFAPATGSDCSPAVGASSAQWAALPCTTTYTLRATR